MNRVIALLGLLILLSQEGWFVSTAVSAATATITTQWSGDSSYTPPTKRRATASSTKKKNADDDKNNNDDTVMVIQGQPKPLLSFRQMAHVHGLTHSLALLQYTGLWSEWNQVLERGKGDVTVFLPTNEAWEELGVVVVQRRTNDDNDDNKNDDASSSIRINVDEQWSMAELQQILWSHVVWHDDFLSYIPSSLFYRWAALLTNSKNSNPLQLPTEQPGTVITVTASLDDPNQIFLETTTTMSETEPTEKEPGRTQPNECTIGDEENNPHHPLSMTYNNKNHPHGHNKKVRLVNTRVDLRATNAWIHVVDGVLLLP